MGFKGTFKVWEVFCILIVVMVTQVYTFIQAHQNIQLN